MKLRIYGGLRGAAQYGLEAEITLEQAVTDGYRVWIDPEGWYVGDPLGWCRWSAWKAKPINEVAETPLDVRIDADVAAYTAAMTKAATATRPAVRANPDCAAGKHDACNGDGWDNRIDAVCDCPCTCHEPKENNS